MIEHDSALIDSTSRLASGEVSFPEREGSPAHISDVQNEGCRVVGDSRSGKEDMRECGRSLPSKPSAKADVSGEVRAIVVAKKQGNACGAKDGRKADI